LQARRDALALRHLEAAVEAECGLSWLD
jgi:hypothetical protein